MFSMNSGVVNEVITFGLKFQKRVSINGFSHVIVMGRGSDIVMSQKFVSLS